jgi:hypothetical protein
MWSLRSSKCGAQEEFVALQLCKSVMVADLFSSANSELPEKKQSYASCTRDRSPLSPDVSDHRNQLKSSCYTCCSDVKSHIHAVATLLLRAPLRRKDDCSTNEICMHEESRQQSAVAERQRSLSYWAAGAASSAGGCASISCSSPLSFISCMTSNPPTSSPPMYSCG